MVKVPAIGLAIVVHTSIGHVHPFLSYMCAKLEKAFVTPHGCMSVLCPLFLGCAHRTCDNVLQPYNQCFKHKLLLVTWLLLLCLFIFIIYFYNFYYLLFVIIQNYW